jgi:hypothetical protein
MRNGAAQCRRLGGNAGLPHPEEPANAGVSKDEASRGRRGTLPLRSCRRTLRCGLAGGGEARHGSAMSDTDATPTDPTAAPETAPTRELPPAARRALAEAAERRAAIEAAASLPPERHGRGGLEPVRYGDWEIKGLAADF